MRAMLWDDGKSRYPLTRLRTDKRCATSTMVEPRRGHPRQPGIEQRTRAHHQIGSHHQKVLIVKGSEGLIAFCGGIDINPDRIHNVGATFGCTFQDVHCRIKGPAAHDLLKIFLERWKDHPDSAQPAGKPNVPLLGWTDDPVKPSIRLRPAGKSTCRSEGPTATATRQPGIPVLPAAIPSPRMANERSSR